MLGYSPTKTQELLGNPDKSANPPASSPACAGLAGEHCILGVAVISAKNQKRQRRKRQAVTAKRKKSQTPKVLTAILTLPNLT